MANEMPSSSHYNGLSRKTLKYGECFLNIVNKMKAAPLTDDDWADMEKIVDPAKWERVGLFLTPQAEVIGWDKYKYYISEYGAGTEWEGTLRNITEQGNRVILELVERNTRGGETDVSNTVTIYEYDDAGKLIHLDVYVMPLEKQAA